MPGEDERPLAAAPMVTRLSNNAGKRIHGELFAKALIKLLKVLDSFMFIWPGRLNLYLKISLNGNEEQSSEIHSGS